MHTPFDIPGTRAQALLEESEGKGQWAALFLPGISGGVFSERFKPLSDAIRAAGISLLRLQSWENTQEVEGKTIAEIQQDIHAALQYLAGNGYSKVGVIGKSFGGAMVLVAQHPSIRHKIAWAPALGVVEEEGNIALQQEKPLKEFPSLLEITIDRTFLQDINVPVCLIHGTADAAIPFENSERMVRLLPQGKLISIPDADHSYKHKDHEDQVIRATVAFFTAQKTLS